MSIVLIISSDIELTQNSLESLAGNSIKVVIASDFFDGMEKLGESDFDVIVIDEKLPDADIYQACSEVRYSSKAPIILIGTRADADIWDKVEELGFDFYLRKPIIPRELEARVRNLIRRSDVEQIINKMQEKKSADLPEVPVTPPAQNETDSPDITRTENKLSQPVLVDSSAEVESDKKNWSSDKVNKLLNLLINGDLAEIIPTINLYLENGFSYPEAERIMESSAYETVRVLEDLTTEGVLYKQPFAKILLTPDGATEITPVVCCPYCNSDNIAKGQLIEHPNCGYVGLEENFKVGSRYICCNCQKELNVIGEEIRRIGIPYQCKDCQEIFPDPATRFRCLETGKSYKRNELQETWINAYYLNEARKIWLEFEMLVKSQFIDFLKYRGYEVEESAKITGKSAVIHTLDILAQKNDAIAKRTIGIDILIAKPGRNEILSEDLLDFEIKASDIDINDKVVIAIPKLALEAKKVAEQHQIKSLEARDLDIFCLV